MVVLLCLGFHNPRALWRMKMLHYAIGSLGLGLERHSAGYIVGVAYAYCYMLESGQGLTRRMIDMEMGRLTFGWTVGVCFVRGNYWAQVVGNVGLWWREVGLLQMKVLGKPLFGFSPFGSAAVSRKLSVEFLPSGLAVVVSRKPLIVYLPSGLAVAAGRNSMCC